MNYASKKCNEHENSGANGPRKIGHFSSDSQYDILRKCYILGY